MPRRKSRRTGRRPRRSTRRPTTDRSSYCSALPLPPPAASRRTSRGRRRPSGPSTARFRCLQALTEIGAEQNTTVIFPLPIDLIGAFMGQPSNGRVPTAGPAPRVGGDD